MDAVRKQTTLKCAFILSMGVVLLVSGGCQQPKKRMPFGPFDIRNDDKHTSTMLTTTVLVPGVIHETRQNDILHRADSSGREFHMLIGPYPRLGEPARIVARNETVETVTLQGFAAAIGQQPIVVINWVRTYSTHTHYFAWAAPDNTVYVFAEETETDAPVVITPEPGATFPRTEITSGQYARIVDGTTLTVHSYFDRGDRSTLSRGVPADIVEFITYVRSREVAAGLVTQNYAFRGRYVDGIPDLPPIPIPGFGRLPAR
jgi:hypothetical protein